MFGSTRSFAVGLCAPDAKTGTNTPTTTARIERRSRGAIADSSMGWGAGRDSQEGRRVEEGISAINRAGCHGLGLSR